MNKHKLFNPNSEQNSGFLFLNKPVGPTSHDMVSRLRRLTGIKKIGHAGTLDPLASGVLIMAIGREATREISGFVKLDKEYEAVLRLGAVSDTYDREGRVEFRVSNCECRLSSVELRINTIEQVLEKFIGVQMQVPPMYSAKKVGGKKLYELARKGIDVERRPVEINIHELELSDYQWPLLKIRVRCSSGTYIRSLAHDIGQALGCGAYLEELKRTAVGEFKLEECINLEELNKENWKNKLNS